MLNNPVYIGSVIWNRREWVMNPETKRRVPRLCPESEWIVTEQSAFRIIPQALWNQVQQRRKAQALGQLTNGYVRVGRGPKYLWSGVLKCDECDSNYIMSDYYRYTCGGHLNWGASVCTNDLRISRKVVEEQCLAALRDDLLTPEALKRIIEKTTRLLAERNRARHPAGEHMQRQLAKVEGEIMNIMTAIRAGILTASTKVELDRAKAKRARLQGALAAQLTKADKVVTLLPRVAERYRALMTISEGWP
jgi:site-specific DNA recombinase